DNASSMTVCVLFFFCQAEDGIRDRNVTGVQTCALPISLVNDARVAAIRDVMMESGGPVRTPEEFTALKEQVKPKVPGRVRQSVVALAPALVQYARVADELKKWTGPAIDDMRKQLEFLLPKHAITVHGIEHLRH